MSFKWNVVSVLVVSCLAASLATAAPAKLSDQQLQATVLELKARLAGVENQLAEQPAMTRAEPLKIVREVQTDASGRPDLPKWMENLKFYGDLRLRYQGECFSGTKDKDRHRARYRLRFGITKTWLDKQMEVGFRLASGNDESPTSTNQTMDDNFEKDEIWIDRAYAKYQPNAVKGLTLVGGKMANPWVHTDLVWDSDVNPEGFWAQYKTQVLEGFTPFASVGFFVTDEIKKGHDTTLVAYQAGFDLQVCKAVKWTSAVAYYDYDHLDKSFRTGNGNNVVDSRLNAGQFHMINLTNIVKFKAWNLPMKVYFDWVHNLGDGDGMHPFNDQSDGYAAGIKVGKNKKKGDWSFGYKYAYIEANSTPGQFNDADFGGANRKGHVFGAKYNLTNFLTAGGKVFHTEDVTGSSENERDTLVQADLEWKF